MIIALATYPSSPPLFLIFDTRLTIVLSITTYREIRRQFPTPAAMEKLKNDCEGDNTSFQREVKAMQGELFKERWYRIILDEAHSIKDYTTTSKYSILGGP